MKKILCLVLSVLLIGSFAGCKKKAESDEPVLKTVYENKEYGWQTEEVKEGEEVAVLHTNYGDITMRFFPEAAPKAVENFKTHIKNGYYNGLTFHRIIENFMIQGGDPKGDGTGGESIWNENFEDEFDSKLLNITGSVAMANSGANTNGSQFFINNNPPEYFQRESYAYDNLYANYKNFYNTYVEQYGEQFKATYPDVDSFLEAQGGISPDSRLVPEEVWKIYEKYGGNISLDGAFRKSGGHTVFAQVIDGMDVVEKIAKVKTDENDSPKKKVVIKTAELIEYKK